MGSYQQVENLCLCLSCGQIRQKEKNKEGESPGRQSHAELAGVCNLVLPLTEAAFGFHGTHSISGAATSSSFVTPAPPAPPSPGPGFFPNLYTGNPGVSHSTSHEMTQDASTVYLTVPSQLYPQHTEQLRWYVLNEQM